MEKHLVESCPIWMCSANVIGKEPLVVIVGPACGLPLLERFNKIFERLGCEVLMKFALNGQTRK